MAGSMNKVILVGRMGQDPQMRDVNGRSVANFSLATDEGYKDRNTGQKVDKTEWHKVVVWGQPAEFCGNYLGKGRLVLVEGKLQTRKWQDQNGQDRYSTEINAFSVQALDAVPQQAQPAQQPQQGQPPRRQQPSDDPGPSFPSEAGGMDDVPF